MQVLEELKGDGKIRPMGRRLNLANGWRLYWRFFAPVQNYGLGYGGINASRRNHDLLWRNTPEGIFRPPVSVWSLRSMIRVSELKKRLDGLDDDCLLLIAHDPEGNSISRLFQVDQCRGDSVRELLQGNEAEIAITINDCEVLIFWPVS